jgi:hypothetical protein
MKWLSCAIALTLWGCASAEPGAVRSNPDAQPGGGGGTQMDAPDETGSGEGSGSGSGMGSGMGSGSGSGTSGCTGTMDLLANGNFDATPLGTGWTAQPIDPAGPLITTDGTLTAQSGTARAWMGGYEKASGNTDTLYQDVMIPANATALQITGFYQVKTAEVLPGTYDKSTVEIVSTANAQLELIKSLTDDNGTTAWTALDKTITNLAAMKGQTVRVKFSTSGDSTDATSFYYDTIKLNVTCP